MITKDKIAVLLICFQFSFFCFLVQAECPGSPPGPCYGCEGGVWVPVCAYYQICCSGSCCTGDCCDQKTCYNSSWTKCCGSGTGATCPKSASCCDGGKSCPDSNTHFCCNYGTGQTCPNGETCCNNPEKPCCNPALCESCIDGQCKVCGGDPAKVCCNGQCKTNTGTNTCRLDVQEIDTTFCICGGNICGGGGAKYPQYQCAGTCIGCYTCSSTQTTILVPYWYATPVCTDTGWWPIGYECNENSDCEITSWNYEQVGWIEHFDCQCIIDTI